MSDETPSERRLAENEVLYRQANERVVKNFDSIQAAGEDEGQQAYAKGLASQEINFFCECSDLGCHKRISLTPDEYKNIHRNSSQFVILPGHENPEIEHVINTTDKYSVVEKYMAPPKTV
jgi:hypothetical protein